MPLIKMTPMVRLALWALRIYLLILLSLIGLKFVRVFSHSGNAAPPRLIAPAATGQSLNPVP